MKLGKKLGSALDRKRRDDKIRAMRRGGWKWEEIAAELRCSSATIARALAGCGGPWSAGYDPGEVIPRPEGRRRPASRFPQENHVRFWRNVQMGKDAHQTWAGGTFTFKVYGDGLWRSRTPARYIYQETHGSLPKGRLSASCGDPWCVDVRHLAPAVKKSVERRSLQHVVTRFRNQGQWKENARLGVFL